MTGPSSRAMAAAPAVARFDIPRYLPASPRGIRSVAQAQLTLAKIPMPRPMNAPNIGIPARLRVSARAPKPMAARAQAPILSRLRPQRSERPPAG
jgi:hypothetical protein